MSLKIAILLASIASTEAQSFQNLNFESASIPPLTPVASGVPIGEALPGWNGYLIDSATGIATPDGEVSYDGISTGGAFIALVGQTQSGPQPLQGNYSLFMFGGGAPSTIASEVSQTGLIPAGSKSLIMEAWESPNASPVVTINGQVIDMVPMQTVPDSSLYGGSYTIYGGNVSTFAGNAGTLAFSDPAPASSPPSQFLLDNISFSSGSVSEPDAALLATVGGSLFVLYRLFMKRQ
jgi:hypothetical protein